MTKPKRLTIGMRVRILTVEEYGKRIGRKFKKGEDVSWCDDDGGKHALLQERSNGSFSILTIGDKFKDLRVLPKETTGVIDGGGAWVEEDKMEFVNADFEANLDYMDWYQENEDNFCGDCGEWYPDNGSRCPNPECPGGRWDNGECTECGTKLTGKFNDYCKKCKTHQE